MKWLVLYYVPLLILCMPGDVYEGNFVAGLKSTSAGQEGRMTYKHGDEYVGGWRDDMEHGG